MPLNLNLRSPSPKRHKHKRSQSMVLLQNPVHKKTQSNSPEHNKPNKKLINVQLRDKTANILLKRLQQI